MYLWTPPVLQEEDYRLRVSIRTHCEPMIGSGHNAIRTPVPYKASAWLAATFFGVSRHRSYLLGIVRSSPSQSWRVLPFTQRQI